MLEKYTYKVIVQLLGLDNEEIAKAFGYKNAKSFRTTSKSKQVKEGIAFVANKAINTFDNRGFVKPMLNSNIDIEAIKKEWEKQKHVLDKGGISYESRERQVPLSEYNNTCEKYQSLFNDNLKTIGKLIVENERLKKENTVLKML